MHGHNNGVKSALLLGGMFGLLLLIGGGLSAYSGSSSFIWIFGLMGVASTFYSYWNSDKLAIRAMNAQPVSAQQAPQLYRIVEELSAKAQQPMPAIYIAPTGAPNAFATGRNPQHAAVCVTGGILELLDEREIRAVLGHELMHVYNRDIMTSSIAAGMAGIISTIGQALSFGTMFGGRGSSDRNPAGVLATLAAALLAPLAAAVIQFALSRTREFDADEDGSRLTGDPLGLASALEKLERGTQARPLKPTKRLVDTSHSFIANPFRAGDVQQIFATHPPMDQRIARLYDQARQLGQL
ncbi:zinc metalloprotease HtpX [Nigerium massiliense]|uniref:zinc metalloprotease HtpX n=1 Tax=Nigerium massiliense TaxID=1522317 RepID=UPI00058EF61A|nr:zinc metalloprotease HtpX [Nigerium massiliense]